VTQAGGCTASPGRGSSTSVARVSPAAIAAAARRPPDEGGGTRAPASSPSSSSSPSTCPTHAASAAASAPQAGTRCVDVDRRRDRARMASGGRGGEVAAAGGGGEEARGRAPAAGPAVRQGTERGGRRQVGRQGGPQQVDARRQGRPGGLAQDGGFGRQDGKPFRPGFRVPPGRGLEDDPEAGRFQQFEGARHAHHAGVDARVGQPDAPEPGVARVGRRVGEERGAHPGGPVVRGGQQRVGGVGLGGRGWGGTDGRGRRAQGLAVGLRGGEGG
jgi:hypothetical protein